MPAIIAAVLLTCLPMLGDYFTSDLLSGSPRTSMVGNLINTTVLTPGQTGQAGAFVLLVLVVALVPMLLYVRSSPRRGAVAREHAMNRREPRCPLVSDPWRAAAWSAGHHHRLPGVVAAAGADRGAVLVQRRPVAHALAGLLVPLVLGRPASARCWHDASLHTALTHTLLLGVVATVITVPLGVAFALGVDRWRGRLPEGANFVMLLSFVIPETLLAVALLFLVTQLATPLQLGTSAQVAGLVTFQLSYPVVIVRARLMTIGKQYEQAAIDLGASPMGAVRRVLLPMLMPAIFASAVLVFADVIDDFVIVRYLSGDASTEPTSVKIYNTARAAPTPALNALATLMLLASFLAVIIGLLAYRRLSRGEKDVSSLESFAGGL